MLYSKDIMEFKYKMNKNNNYLIQQDLIDHAKHPRNYGLFKDADFVSEELNPSCGDSVQLSGKVLDGVLQDIRFEGVGCVLSLAMASKLTEYVEGMQLSMIMQLNEGLVEELLNLSLGPNRLQCGMLSVIALKKGVGEYQRALNSL